MKSRLGTIWISIVLSALFTQLIFSQTESSHFYQVKGRVIDSGTNHPVALASIYIAGASVGTVANTEGDFVLKIPWNYKNDFPVVDEKTLEPIEMILSGLME